MKITIVCAGKIKEKYLSAGIAEFLKRLKPYAQVEIREIHEEKMPEAPSPAEKEQTLAREGEKLLKLVPEGSYLYVLDVYGKLKSSEQLAKEIADLGLRGRSSITFLIGGAFGGGARPRGRAHQLLADDLHAPDGAPAARRADLPRVQDQPR